MSSSIIWAPVVKLVDAADSKSVALLEGVPVQVRLGHHPTLLQSYGRQATRTAKPEEMIERRSVYRSFSVGR